MAYGSELGPIALAHRGGASLAPENTLAAFGLSTALGIRYLETDVRLTADGELVCFHDATLDRVTDGRGPVARHTLASLRQLRVLGREPIPTLLRGARGVPGRQVHGRPQGARSHPARSRRCCSTGISVSGCASRGRGTAA